MDADSKLHLLMLGWALLATAWALAENHRYTQLLELFHLATDHEIELDPSFDVAGPQHCLTCGKIKQPEHFVRLPSHVSLGI